LIERGEDMKRVVDKPYFAYSAYTALTSELYVKCPKCYCLGIVTANKDTDFFKCTNCGHTKEKERTIYRYDVHNQCQHCGRYYHVDIKDINKQHFQSLHVACPFCGTIMSGKVHKIPLAYCYIGEISDGYEPFLGFELWFLSSFQSHPVWALNKEHLDYLNADLRKKPIGHMKTQADHLPTFMKTAKNRKHIVKLLKKMQEDHK